MKKVLSSQQIKLEIQLKVKPDKILITDPWPLGIGSSQEVIFCELKGWVNEASLTFGQILIWKMVHQIKAFLQPSSRDSIQRKRKKQTHI